MIKREMISDILEYHREYRSEYLQDFDDKSTNYDVLNILCESELDNTTASFNVYKDNLKKKRTIDMMEKYSSKYDGVNCHELDLLWHSSLEMLDIHALIGGHGVNLIEHEVIMNEKILEIGREADHNRSRLKFNDLLIKVQNKRRKENGKSNN
ncbi:hypothetical protein [Butyrivibrio sp. NC2007]|uniref:hypothetical protein n=1 Tax=Butyrivibrio sp. NC2007 TaxID=1280683 RepID=UPI0003B7AC33|nr:hypothetical protein [Butyrivibrio sp. NC2007]